MILHAFCVDCVSIAQTNLYPLKYMAYHLPPSIESFQPPNNMTNFPVVQIPTHNIVDIQFFWYILRVCILKPNCINDTVYQPILIQLNRTIIMHLKINSKKPLCIILNLQLKPLRFYFSNDPTNALFIYFI